MNKSLKKNDNVANDIAQHVHNIIKYYASILDIIYKFLN